MNEHSQQGYKREKERKLIVRFKGNLKTRPLGSANKHEQHNRRQNSGNGKLNNFNLLHELE